MKNKPNLSFVDIFILLIFPNTRRMINNIFIGLFIFGTYFTRVLVVLKVEKKNKEKIACYFYAFSCLAWALMQISLYPLFTAKNQGLLKIKVKNLSCCTISDIPGLKQKLELDFFLNFVDYLDIFLNSFIVIEENKDKINCLII